MVLLGLDLMALLTFSLSAKQTKSHLFVFIKQHWLLLLLSLI